MGVARIPTENDTILFNSDAPNVCIRKVSLRHIDTQPISNFRDLCGATLKYRLVSGPTYHPITSELVFDESRQLLYTGSWFSVLIIDLRMESSRVVRFVYRGISGLSMSGDFMVGVDHERNEIINTRRNEETNEFDWLLINEDDDTAVNEPCGTSHFVGQTFIVRDDENLFVYEPRQSRSANVCHYFSRQEDRSICESLPKPTSTITINNRLIISMENSTMAHITLG